MIFAGADFVKVLNLAHDALFAVSILRAAAVSERGEASLRRAFICVSRNNGFVVVVVVESEQCGLRHKLKRGVLWREGASALGGQRVTVEVICENKQCRQ